MQHERLELSAASLHYAVEMCESNDNYIVVVFSRNKQEKELALSIITDRLDMTQYVIPAIDGVVSWKNGSCIMFANQCDVTNNYQIGLSLVSASLTECDKQCV